MPGPRLRGSGELHIVGRDEVVTIADPEGVAQCALALADGSRTERELLAALADAFPRLAEHDVRGTLADLLTAGLLEDVAQVARVRTSVLPRRGAHGRAALGGSHAFYVHP